MPHSARSDPRSHPLVPAPLPQERLWLSVCQTRGTPAPEPQQRSAFLQQLDGPGRQRLHTVLELARRGQEPPEGLSLLSWAAACTRPALLRRLEDFGLHFLSADLFSCSLRLIDAGWDMPARLGQLAHHPEDVEALRALMAEHALVELKDAACGDGNEGDAQSQPALDQDDFSDFAEHRFDSPMNPHDFDGSEHVSALPDLPTRFASVRHEGNDEANDKPGANVVGPSLSSSASATDRPQQLRLFGKKAAHRLEITPHRRGNDFLGVHVITVDSAHALPGGGGFDWKNKLVLQLTPEEMPGLIATLIGITPSTRFGHHGASRDKFIEVRRQADGLVMVTGVSAASYPVPMSTATAYYVLDLFCRAMAMGTPGRSAADILAIVRSSHGF